MIEIVIGVMAVLFIIWVTAVWVEMRRDYKWRRAMRNRLMDDWRQVPPPNWRSSRGGVELW